ncbi:hypothetical protein PENTCL1PPCAC_30731, partial [Pristionchus entomophagus]
GIAACLNILMIVSKRTADKFMPNIEIKDITYNFILFGSHCFSLSHTTGKVVLIVASRFTSICFPLTFWTQSNRMTVSAFLMFAIPVLLCNNQDLSGASLHSDFAKMYPNAHHRSFIIELTKVISSLGYALFLVITTPMCAASVYSLHRAQCFNQKQLAKQERNLLIHTVITTTAHMIKSAQQIFWFVTMITNDAPLFDLATKMYNLPNTLTTFVPPLLLIATSTPVRRE